MTERQPAPIRAEQIGKPPLPKNPVISLARVFFYLSIVAIFVTLALEIPPFRAYTFDIFFIPCLYLTLIALAKHRGRLRIRLSRFDKTLLVLFAIITVSFVLSYDVAKSVVNWMDWIRLVGLFFVSRILFECGAVSPKHFERLLALIGLTLLFIGILQSVTGIPIGLVGNYFGESRDQMSPLDVTGFDVRYRISGTTSNPIVYALWINLLCGLGLAHLFSSKRYILLLLLTAAMAFVLLNTFSRGALVTFAFFLVFILWQNFKLLDDLKSLYKVALVTTLLILAATSLLAEMVFLKDTIHLLMARSRDVTEVEDITNTVRVRLLLGGFVLLKEPKILLSGTGAGNFHPVCYSRGLEAAPKRWKDYSRSYSGIHNAYMKLLVEHGIFALIVFLVLFYVFTTDVLKRGRASSGNEHDPWRVYTVALGTSIALVASQVYESVTEYHLLLPIFVILAFMLSRKHTDSNG